MGFPLTAWIRVKSMHTVDLLKEAILLAESCGYGVRHEWLGGGQGGGCEIAGRKWLFIDLALNPLEQLDQVVETLRADPQLFVGATNVSVPLARYMALRRSA